MACHSSGSLLRHDQQEIEMAKIKMSGATPAILPSHRLLNCQ
jgi:hypothetical protein